MTLPPSFLQSKKLRKKFLKFFLLAPAAQVVSVTYLWLIYTKSMHQMQHTARKCKKFAEICKNDKVRKDGQNALFLRFRNGTKNNNTSSHILLEHKNPLGSSFYATLLKKKFVKEGYRLGPISPRPGSTPGRIRPKNNNTCGGP